MKDKVKSILEGKKIRRLLLNDKSRHLRNILKKNEVYFGKLEEINIKDISTFISKNIDRILDSLEITERIEDFLDNPLEFIADSISDYMKGDYRVYEDAIVKNIKRRGFPDYEEVMKEVAKELGINYDDAIEQFDETDFDELFWEEVSFVINENILQEFPDFVVKGRSGGYWGLQVTPWDCIIVDRDKIKSVIKDIGKNFDKLLKDRKIYDEYGYELDEEDIEEMESYELICSLALTTEEYLRNYYSPEDYLTLSDECIKMFKKFEEYTENIIDDFEKPDRWVDLILANEYVKK